MARQITVKVKYALWVTSPEKSAMTRVLDKCPTQKVPTEGQAPPNVNPTPPSGGGSGTKIVIFQNCTEMRKTYPHGVGRPGAVDRTSSSGKPVTNFFVDADLYNANKKSDRDKDGIACEA